jgi:hypothetical protein
MKSIEYLFGDMLGYPDADTILAALRNAPAGLTRTEISTNVFRHNAPANRITRALEFLVEYHLAEYHEEDTGTPRRRQRWFATMPTVGCGDEQHEEHESSLPPSKPEASPSSCLSCNSYDDSVSVKDWLRAWLAGAGGDTVEATLRVAASMGFTGADVRAAVDALGGMVEERDGAAWFILFPA